jgi:phospholipid transport system transporter-binding protein
VNKRLEQATPVLAVGERWILSGALTMDSAAQVLSASGEAALPSSGVISLSGVDRVDSAGVAVLLAWERRAAAEGKSLSFAEVPLNLAALAKLYGVVELLAPGTGRSPAPVV